MAVNFNVGIGAVAATLAVLAVTAVVVAVARQGGVNVNPFDEENIVNRGAEKIGRVITQDDAWTLGGSFHEFLNGTYDPNGTDLAAQLADQRN